MSVSILDSVELVLWNLPEAGTDHPSVEQTRFALGVAGLDADRAADIPDGTAFRRAADSLRNPTTLVRPFQRADKTVCVQVDREEPDGHDGLKREKVGVYALQSGSVEPVNGACRSTLATLAESYSQAQRVYTWSDVSKVIQEILKRDGLGIFSPRRAGGVYFAPVSDAQRGLLERVEQFATSVGVRFLRYQVPDTSAQRAEISEAIAAAFQADLTDHATAIGAYNPETRLGIIRNRREALAATLDHVGRLSHLLSAAAASALRDWAGQLEQQITAAESVADAHQSAQARAGGRRIMTGV